MDQNGGTKTVCFSVGGILFTVSISLIDSYPDTMLAKLISGKWKEQPSGEIFVDRDGSRFSFVLDYMRDQKVYLPPLITRESFMNELRYFGFHDVPDEAIASPNSIHEATKSRLSIKQDHDKALKELNAGITKLEKERCYLMMAYLCFESYCQKGRFLAQSFDKNHESYRSANHFDKVAFNANAQKFGLKLVKVEDVFRSTYVNVTVGLRET